ncbi:phytoene/squalene synthase family protein [Streptomyces sp. NPDC048717]|uniref:phytoene/squalene synthase family protein n=1 Tax=Streptomyces sp. NPDC048717 TaxID=3154928 RepID=UPI003414841A
MTARELNAAGITDPVLRAAYRHCRVLNARHGRTYFLATRLLPPARRPAVHALYGFARWADDIVDAFDAFDALDARDPRDLLGARGIQVARRAAPVGVPGPSGAPGTARRAAALDRLSEDLTRGLTGGHGVAPAVVALADTSRRYAIDHRHFADFLTAMRSDLTVTEYASYDDLRAYMHGSAAVIGLQLLPVLGTVVPRADAAPYAAELGVAFQLTNFLRDVGEDLDRGRIYLPQDLLAAHRVDRGLLRRCRDSGRTEARVVAALREFAALTRSAYRRAAPGVPLLQPVARPCVRTALVLYGGILDAVAADGWTVLHRRAAVPGGRRALVAADGLLRLAAARLAARCGTRPAATGNPGPNSFPREVS